MELAAADLSKRRAHPAVVDARNVVAHGHEQKNREPEDPGDNHQLRPPGTIFGVHEEEHDQGGFAGRDGQCHDDVELPEVDESSPHGDSRQRHQR